VSPPTFAMLLTLCLVGGTAAAQPSAVHREEDTRFIELTADSSGEAAEVLISPGRSTAFFFDAELLRAQDGEDTVELEQRAAFKLVDSGRATMGLIPSDRLAPGQRLSLRVRFKDGAAPASAAFTLVVSATRAERLVEVYREARPAESYRQEAAEARAATAKCLDALERTRAERAGPGGLPGLLASQQVDTSGVRTLNLNRVATLAPGNALTVHEVWTYRSATQVVVEVTVAAPEGAQPWTAEGAMLVGKRGPEAKAPTVWQPGPVTGVPDQRVGIMVAVDASPRELQGTYTLRLWEAGTGRAVVLGNVTFP